MKQSQLEFIVNCLKSTGEVSRNLCLLNYITRLGARIDDLKKAGWIFVTETRPTMKPDGSNGKDFVYIATYIPSETAQKSSETQERVGNDNTPYPKVPDAYKREITQKRLL